MLTLWLVLSLPAQAGKRPPPPDLDATAQALVDAALASSEPYDELRELCDTIGHRFSGSPALERAVTWGAAQLAADGLVATLEPVQVPVWTRGTTDVELLSPAVATLPALTLGGSVATPAEGIEADVLVVSDFDDLTAHAELAKGRIIVWNVPFTDYGTTVRYRLGGASAAAKVGGVASLVRSVTPVSLASPHTGMQRYEEGVLAVPALAITLEDAERLARLQASGVTPRMRVSTSAHTDATALSHNVLGWLPGRELPKEVVTLACHLDTWDVGQGAQDDGAGCVTVMEAAALLAALPVAPRRSVRVVLYTNEESGLAGGKEHARLHAGERIVAALEDDTGSGAPTGFRVQLPGLEDPKSGDITAILTAFGDHLAPLATFGSNRFRASWGGADIGPLSAQGTLNFGLDHDETGYWPVHHTEADTFEKVDPALVRQNVASVAVLAWLLAEWPTAIPGSTR